MEIISITKATLFAGVFLAVSLLVVLAILLDLWDGVHTARVTKERVHSHKLRVTIDKLSEYWRFLIIGFLIDCIGLLFDFYLIPFVLVLFGVGLIIVEIKSMFEHAKRRKSHTSELQDILHKIVQCATEKDAHDIVERINSMINSPQTTPTENTVG